MVSKIRVMHPSDNGEIPEFAKEALVRMPEVAIIELGPDLHRVSTAFAHLHGGHTIAGHKMPASLSEAYVVDLSEFMKTIRGVDSKAADWYLHNALNCGMVDLTMPGCPVFFAREECEFLPDKVTFPNCHYVHIPPQAA